MFLKNMLMKKALRLSLALIVLVNVFIVSGMAMAASDELVFDNYDRAALADFAGSEVGAQWTGGDAGKGATIDNNALKLEFASSGWFGTGGGVDASTFKYLKIRVKGAAGGEGESLDLNYAVGEAVKTTGVPFSALISASGDPVPAVTKDYQDILIDLVANKIEKGIQALHFNFHEGSSGTIWIDSISFTNEGPAKVEAAPEADPVITDTAVTDTAAAPVAAEANPKTGDTSNMSLYLSLALISGLAALVMVYKGRSTKRD